MATGESGRALLLSTALAFAVFGSACAHRMGKQSAQGMMAGIRAQSSDDPSQQLSRVAAGRRTASSFAA